MKNTLSSSQKSRLTNPSDSRDLGLGKTAAPTTENNGSPSEDVIQVTPNPVYNIHHHGPNIVKTTLHPSMAEDFYSVPFSHETNTSSHTEEAISLMPNPVYSIHSDPNAANLQHRESGPLTLQSQGKGRKVAGHHGSGALQISVNPIHSVCNENPQGREGPPQPEGVSSSQRDPAAHSDIQLLPRPVHKVNAAPQEYKEPIRSRGREGPRSGPQHITTSATGQEPDSNYYYI